MTTLSVGQLYHPSRTSWPPDVAQYSYRGGGHELLLFLSDPSEREVEDYAKGAASYALHVGGPLVVLCYRYGAGGRWSDAPYSWHLVPTDERDMPSADLESNKRALLHTVLIDASTGIVRALRLTSWSPSFTRAVHGAIRAQADMPWDAAQYDAALDRLYRRSTDRIAADCTIRCEGGD